MLEGMQVTHRLGAACLVLQTAFLPAYREHVRPVFLFCALDGHVLLSINYGVIFGGSASGPGVALQVRHAAEQ
jgi:hypothetical protein